MKKSIKIVLVVFLLLVNGGFLFGQETRIELGDRYFDQFDYKKAIILYEGVHSNQIPWQINAKLGDCYYNTSRPKIALKYYIKAMDANNDISASYLLKYALCLQSTGGSQDLVNEAFQKYYDKIGITKTENIEEASKDSSFVQPENLSINSKFSDFGAYIFSDTLFFSSARENPAKKRRFNKRLYKWNNQPFLDIYTAVVERNDDIISLKLIPPDSSTISVNTVAHESSVAITNDGKTMYFSGGGVVKNNKLEYNEKGTANLKLRRASRDPVTNKWIVTDKDKEAMKRFDFKNYSIGNPALSPDNKRLFFVSCAPFSEAKGQTDIYYVDIKDDGTYGKITSIPEINTSGRESFPYMAADGTLYFSSDGIYNNTLGLGLMDIYKINDIDKVIIGEKKGKVVHLEYPFNSVMDDFGFFIEEDQEGQTCKPYAYFTSNRVVPNAKGDDDIYRVKMKAQQSILGTVVDSSTNGPLANAEVELIDSTGMVLKTVVVDSTGTFGFDVECDQSYRLRGSMDRYYADVKQYDPTVIKESIILKLRPYPCEIIVNHVEFDSINHIEFGFDLDSIGPKAQDDLSKVLEILLPNPDIKIRIESYTDSRGSAKYNLDLSDRRAKNTKKYLIKQGVQESQIVSAKGFGENCLLVSDEEINNSPLSERNAKHAKNRRSRFILDCKNEVEGCQEMDLGN